MNRDLLSFRQPAIDWWNSRERDFAQGIAVLESSGFRPGVVRKLKRDGVNGPAATARLKHLMRELMRAWAMSPDELADTDPEQGILNGQDLQQEQQTDDTRSLKLVEAAAQLEQGQYMAPKIVAYIVKAYASAYKEREIAHRQMAELSEENTPEVMAQRKQFSDRIDECSALMERLYPFYDRYTSTGTEPKVAEVKQALRKQSPAQAAPEPDAADSFDGLSKEELQKRRKSVSTKIGRAKNMLDYQQETKADTPNPMPECPKRLKYEKKIEVLSAELERIDYAIAALG